MSQQLYEQDTLEELLNSLVDETLSDADEARLAAMLAESEAARRRYRQWMELHAALNWDYAAAAAEHTSASCQSDADMMVTTTRFQPRRHSLLLGGSLAAAGLLALTISWFAVLQRPGKPVGAESLAMNPMRAGQIVELVSLGGAASWSDGGRVISVLTNGDRLCAGTVSLEGESTFMSLRFDDGTVITLAGESMLEFDAKWQKNLVLRHGSLSVDACPQPPGRPMLIRTPTAEIEVVGTIFSLSADKHATHLGVEEGSVRFMRLADGQSIEVNEHSAATASLVATEPLEVARPTAIPSAYRGTLGGVAANATGIHAEPYVAGRGDDGSLIVHYGVTVGKSASGFVSLHDDSVVSVRFRTAIPEAIRLMISMRRPGGTFGGNFETKVLAKDAALVDDSAVADPAGWRWINIPMRDFTAILSDLPVLVPGHAIGTLLVDTFTSKARLEVAEVIVRRQDVGADAR